MAYNKTNWVDGVTPLSAGNMNKIEGQLESLENNKADKTTTSSLTTRMTNVENNKVDKVSGKGLSTEDYTTTEKNKLAGIEANAQVNTVTSVAGKTGAVTVTKGDVGLGSVQNYGIATKAEAEAGTSNAKYMTPLRVKEAISTQGRSLFSMNRASRAKGVVEFTNTVAKKATITLNIPIPAGMQNGMVLVRKRLSSKGPDEYNGGGLVAFINTNVNDALVFGDGDNAGFSAWTKADVGYISRWFNNQTSNFSSDVTGSHRINIFSLYISGSNIKMVVKNDDATYDDNMFCRVNWEVW